MRKNLKSLSPILWAVVAAFIISIFAVWGGAGRLGESRDPNTIATVGKTKISTDAYVSNLRQRIESLQRQFKELNASFIQQMNLPQQVLEQLIQQEILTQIAEDMKLNASNDELREKIKAYPVFQKDGQFVGFEEYKKILEWNRMPVSVFEENLKKEILMEKTIKMLTAGVSFTQGELWENYKSSNESVRMEFVPIEITAIESEDDFTLEEKQIFFEKNKDNYKIPEKREADYVFFNIEDFKKEVELADPEIEEYYNNNEPQFTEPEKVRVSRIFIPYEGKERELVLTEIGNLQDRINQGEDFGSVAKIHSKDGKAGESGDWGLFEWRSLSVEEQEKIAELEVGEMSQPLELDGGAAILKVTEKEEAIQKPLDEVKDQITNILTDQKARDLIEQRVAGLEKNAQREKSLDIAAQKWGYKIKTTGPAADGESFAEEIDPSGSISTALFQLEVNEISTPIYTYKGTGLAQLRQIIPPRAALLEDVEDKVNEDLSAERKKEKAYEKMKSIKAELATSDLESLARKHDLEYKTAEEHKRGGYLSVIGENVEVDEKAFSLPLNEASDPIEYATGYVLIRILDRKEVTEAELQENMETERETYLDAKKNKFFISSMAKMREEIGVEIRYDLFLKINSDILARFGGQEDTGS
jgi:peptidyl-prolyl cis-trans isomerase D